MAKVFDISICPVCDGAKEIDAGQLLKDARTYLVKTQCPRCKGKGRIGIERQEVSNG